MQGARRWLTAVVVGVFVASLLATPAQAAAVPTGLKMVSSTTTTMRLDWQSVSNAPQYRVQFSTSASMASPVTVRFTASQGTITGLRPNTYYYFRVRVISASGATNLSNYTKAPFPRGKTRALAVPTGLGITSRVSDALGVAWTPSEGAVKYELQRSTVADMAGATTTQTTTNDLTVKPLDAQTDYWFRVRAVSSMGLPSAYTPIVKGTTTPTGQPDPSAVDTDLRVANFNVFGIDADANVGNRKVWATRKPEVAKDIVDNRADVVGLQEANQSTVYYAANSGMTQYFDLLNAVNARGVRYALANNKNYNCERFVSSENCVKTDQGASRGVRILYNTATLSLQQQGSLMYQHQTGSVERYLAWATFRVKANGAVVLFVTTHLQPFDRDVQVSTRVAQWGELISWVQTKRSELGGVPVAITGDFNTTKNTDYAADTLPAMKNAGFGDVLNQEFNVNPIAEPRAETTVNGWVNTRNGWSKDLRGNTDEGQPWTYHQDRLEPRATQRTGNNIDWIFASNELRVKEWKVVVNYDPTTLMVSRTVPSDHNMVRATLVLPPPR